MDSKAPAPAAPAEGCPGSTMVDGEVGHCPGCVTASAEVRALMEEAEWGRRVLIRVDEDRLRVAKKYNTLRDFVVQQHASVIVGQSCICVICEEARAALAKGEPK